MSEKKISPKQKATAKAAVAASLLAQLRQPHEIAKISLLLLVWAHTRMRSGYTLIEDGTPLPMGKQRHIPKTKGYSVKKPRSRFL